MHRSTIELLEKCLLTTSKSDASVHPCVITLDAYHAVSFFHGPHSELKLKEQVSLYSVIDEVSEYQTVVHAVSEKFKVIVFKLIDGQFPFYPKGINSMWRGQQYKQLGVSSKRTPIWHDGIVSEKFVDYFIGTSDSATGDSGSGIFNSSGYLVGMSVGQRKFEFKDLSKMSLADVAEHRPDTILVSVELILGMAGINGLESSEKRDENAGIPVSYVLT